MNKYQKQIDSFTKITMLVHEELPFMDNLTYRQAKKNCKKDIKNNKHIQDTIEDIKQYKLYVLSIIGDKGNRFLRKEDQI